eukprot:6908852-Ditylum_brightwellii.AAC.1
MGKQSFSPRSKTDLIGQKTSSYNHAIRACASNIEDDNAKLDAFLIAIDTYKRLCNSKYCQPDEYTYIA